MSNILVTGGAGFIGSHTSIILLEEGHNLIILDNFINSSPLCLEKIKELFIKKDCNICERIHIRKVDLKFQKDCYSVFEEFYKKGFKIDSVIHFAGLKDVNESIYNSIKYWENNVLGTINLLKAMDSFDCRSIVFSSSATIYDGNFKGKYKEDSPIAPSNPYGLTKLSIEKILRDLYLGSFQSWKIVNLRYFNPAGAHFTGKIGENPLNKPSNLFPAITQAAIGKINLKVYGDDWHTLDGSPIRDFIHVMDLADAHVLALNYLKNKNKNFVSVNLGSGKGTSVFNFIETFEKTNNCKIPFTVTKRRKGDFAKLVADISFAKKILNWTPKRTLADICRDGWKWQKLNPKGY